MPNNLEKIIDLIKKTGDNCIVLDSTGQPAYVVTTFSAYQNLVSGKNEVVGLSEEQLLEKINRDVANWKATAQEEKLNNWQALESAMAEIIKPKLVAKQEEKTLNQAKSSQNPGESEQKYYFEPID
ncbi:MAG: hypothetical protein WC508_01000 [Patescibacteria group bacterium]